MTSTAPHWNQLFEALKDHYARGLQVLVELETNPEEPLNTRELDRSWSACQRLLSESHGLPLSEDEGLRHSILKQMQANTQMIRSLEARMEESKARIAKTLFSLPKPSSFGENEEPLHLETTI